MILIAHRGNYCGRNILRENTLSYLQEALDAGYNVEIDVRWIDGEWRLGHDAPTEIFPYQFMEDSRVWVHAKTFNTYLELYNNPKVHTFWHDEDEFVFTSKNIKWASAGVITMDGIMVMPEYVKHTWDYITLNPPLGVCSDDFHAFSI